jgi:hypothetical protein
MSTDARKTSNMPSLVSKIANHEVAAQAGAIVTIGLGWACLYLAVTQSMLME